MILMDDFSMMTSVRSNPEKFASWNDPLIAQTPSKSIFIFCCVSSMELFMESPPMETL